jgi:cell division protein ZapA
MAELTRTTVTIYGEDYQLRSDLSEDTVEAIARFVDTRMRQLAVRHPRVPSSRLAVLASMTLAEELMRLEADHRQALEALQAQWRRSDKPALRKPVGTPR